MAMIIEESEELTGERIATVKTSRNEEVLINVDRAVIALAELFSNIENERRGGWSLSSSWYSDELSRVRDSSWVPALSAAPGEGE